MTGGVTGSARASASYSVTAANNATSDRAALGRAIDAVDAAVGASDAHLCQQFTLQALEIMHRLEDRRRAGTWNLASQSSSDLEVWTAHMAPRNAGHHRGVPVVALTSTVDRLIWDADVAGNTSKAGKLEYTKQLHGRRVVASLRDGYRIAFGV